MLPRELSTIREPEERAMEYVHYRQFFNVWEALERIGECERMEVSHMNKDSKVAWLEDYKVCIKFSLDIPKSN